MVPSIWSWEDFCSSRLCRWDRTAWLESPAMLRGGEGVSNAEAREREDGGAGSECCRLGRDLWRGSEPGAGPTNGSDMAV